MRRISVLVICLADPAIADHELLNRAIPAGETLYQDHCAACHGISLEGQSNWRLSNDDGTMPAPPHDQTGHTWHHDNLLLFEYTKLGGQGALEARGVDGFQSGMPAFNGVISDDEIWNILAYIHSTWPERVKEAHASRNPPHQPLTRSRRLRPGWVDRAP